MTCIFCNIIKGKQRSLKVWENRDFILLLVPQPINPGHIILITKKHIDYIFDLKEPLYSEIFRTAKKISFILRKLSQAKRIGLAIDGFGGYFANNDSEQDMANKISHILNLSHSGWAEMSRQAIESSKKFQWSETVKICTRVYQQLLESTKFAP